jgi:hypothetical protein
MYDQWMNGCMINGWICFKRISQFSCAFNFSIVVLCVSLFQNPLHLVCARGYSDILRLLIHAKVFIDGQSINIAAEQCHADVLKLLFAAKKNKVSLSSTLVRFPLLLSRYKLLALESEGEDGWMHGWKDGWINGWWRFCCWCCYC